MAGSKNDFLKPFQDDEQLLSQAKSFYNHLDKVSIMLIIALAVISLLVTIYYYGPYNNKPGRHYKPTHWVMFLGVAFGLTFIATFGIEYFAAAPNLKGAMSFELMVALCNAIYALLGYFIFSILWLACKIPTNAYRPF